MTLITFVVTNEYVVLASDRRVTTMVNGKPIRFEDKALKTVLLRGQMLLGYTGLAEIDGMTMEEWLAETLAGVVPNDIPDVLRSAMVDYYRRTPAVRVVPHHFRLAGFAFDPTRSPATWPIGYEIGNTGWFAKNDRVLARAPAKEFATVMNAFGNRRQVVGAVGSPYSLKALRSLEGAVRTAVRANPLNPGLVYRPIIDFMRGVASRSKGTVGDTILVTSIPRAAVPISGYDWAIPIAQDGLTEASKFPSAFMVTNGSLDPHVYLPASIHPHFQVTRATSALLIKAPIQFDQVWYSCSMPFELFESPVDRRRGVATIRFLSRGRIHLNAAAERMLTDDGVSHVQLMYDTDDLVVGLRPASPGEPGAYLVARAPSKAVITAAGFAEKYRVPLGHRFRLERGDDGLYLADVVLDQDFADD